MFEVTIEVVYGVPYLPYDNLGISKYLDFFYFNAIVFLSPCSRDSYSVVLFVHWNSSMHAIMIFLPLGSFSMQPSPAPSRYFDPSKNKFHIL